MDYKTCMFNYLKAGPHFFGCDVQKKTYAFMLYKKVQCKGGPCDWPTKTINIIFDFHQLCCLLIVWIDTIFYVVFNIMLHRAPLFFKKKTTVKKHQLCINRTIHIVYIYICIYSFDISGHCLTESSCRGKKQIFSSSLSVLAASAMCLLWCSTTTLAQYRNHSYKLKSRSNGV